MFKDREYWSEENLLYIRPHFRLKKCAHIINILAKRRKCDLLDVGCGPATLSKFLSKNINYFGIDIAIREPGPNLIEQDITKTAINFLDKTFDFVVAFGLFEYIGNLQHQKLLEMNQNLREDGKFITSYLNFYHRHPFSHPAYNNKMSIDDFIMDLKSIFSLDRFFPASYNWHGSEPKRNWLRNTQMYLNINIPVIGRLLAIEYLFICSKKK